MNTTNLTIVITFILSLGYSAASSSSGEESGLSLVDYERFYADFADSGSSLSNSLSTSSSSESFEDELSSESQADLGVVEYACKLAANGNFEFLKRSFSEFPAVRGFLTTIAAAETEEVAQEISDHLKGINYVPEKREVSRAVFATMWPEHKPWISNLIIEAWQDYLDFDGIHQIMLLSAQIGVSLPYKLVTLLNRAKPTIALSQALIKALTELSDIRMVYNFFPFFGIKEQHHPIKSDSRASSILDQLRIEINSRLDKLDSMGLVVTPFLNSYLRSKGASVEDVLERAVKADAVVAINNLISIKNADPFTLDSITGKPLSDLPECSAEARKILVRAQASFVFPKIKHLYQSVAAGELVGDNLKEIGDNLIEMEFIKRRRSMIPTELYPPKKKTF